MLSSEYYRYSRHISFASAISLRQRKKIFDLFMEAFKPDGNTKVLDVGVTCGSDFRESNFFETCYPYPKNVTCVGTEDGSYLERAGKCGKFIRVKPDARLPFADKEFDLVFSNAVLEHVGDAERRERFISEICRVGGKYFISVPYRWFPVEHHTGIPLLHYLPGPVYRKLLKALGVDYWSKEENLDFFDIKQMNRLFEKYGDHKVKGIYLCGMPTNLAAYGPAAYG